MYLYIYSLTQSLTTCPLWVTSHLYRGLTVQNSPALVKSCYWCTKPIEYSPFVCYNISGCVYNSSSGLSLSRIFFLCDFICCWAIRTQARRNRVQQTVIKDLYSIDLLVWIDCFWSIWNLFTIYNLPTEIQILIFTQFRLHFY